MYSNAYKLIRKMKVKEIKKNVNYIVNNNEILYFYLNNNTNSQLLSSNYLYRLGLFIRLCGFFKVFYSNFQMLLRVFYSRFYNIWLLFVFSGKRSLYYFILKNTIKLYKKLFINKKIIKTITFLVQPNHFLIDLPLSVTGRNSIKPLLLKQINNKWKLGSYRHKKIMSNLTINDFGENFFTIHFIRTQRRYNKRRYSRVRAFSRPSFFAGISLSSMFVGSFWNGTIKNVDWLTAWPVVIDVNVILFILLSYTIFRLYRVYYITVFVRKRGKIKIVNALNRIFTTISIKNIFRK